MKKVEDLFRAKASNPFETAMLYNGNAGFIIPDYQRQYDWSEKNIERLHYDILNGFHRFSKSADASAFTFLGTIILVEQTQKEKEFSGQSLAIVDGQQRLTTLALFACALCEVLKKQLSETNFSSIDEDLATWLKSEADERLAALYACAVGSQRVAARKTYPFSRIVRRGDIRGRDYREADYNSPIGKFIEGFWSYHEEDEEIEYKLPTLGNETSAEKLEKNFRVIRTLVSSLNCADWYEDTECELFDIEWVRKGQYRNLFERLQDHYRKEADIHEAVNRIPELTVLHDLVRLLLFSSYFCNCVVLTRVTTEDESAAFDIFDALNTTGEPLTALETLKPRVISFEESCKGYSGSVSENAFDRINEHLEQRFSDTSRKQSETKDLIVTFALYIAGEKQPKDLATQRNFLRKSYEDATKKGEENAHQFVDALARIAEFRRFYWQEEGIQELARFHDNKTVSEIQLLTTFIRDMKTSLALPILARYWDPDMKYSGDANFIQVIRSVVAFLVLRRAATGGTAGIDADFRAIMEPKKGRGANRKFDLCASSDSKKKCLTPKELKTAFLSLLEHKLKHLDKATWIGQVVDNPLYQQSKELVRFMILSAAHQALPSQSIPGTWEKSGVRASASDKNFLDYRTWTADIYGTVEHVAPESQPERGWSKELYKNNLLRHSIGNLVLLPPEENAAIGNKSWEQKKIFYLALTESRKEEQSKRIKEAHEAGISFSETTKSLLENGDRLPLLEPLREIKEWNEDIVRRRGENIASLCWDKVWPWLH